MQGMTNPTRKTMFTLVKHIHLTAVAISISFFLIRGMWALYSPKKLKLRWVRVLPHIVDTVLLVSAITLAFLLRQYPFVDHWLTAKVLALCLYIVLGSIALKRAGSQKTQKLAFAGALMTFAYIVATAVTHNPIPWNS